MFLSSEYGDAGVKDVIEVQEKDLWADFMAHGLEQGRARHFLIAKFWMLTHLVLVLTTTQAM